MHTQYHALIKSYCSLNHNNKRIEIIHEGNEFEVEGFNFRLKYFPEFNTDLLHICCDVCKPLPQHREQVYPVMLAANLVRFSKGGPIVSLCKQTLQIMTILRITFNDLTAAKLDQVLKGMAEDAKKLSQTLSAIGKGV